MFIKKQISVLCVILFFVTHPACAEISESDNEPFDICKQLEVLNASPQCKDQDSDACDNLKFDYYCQCGDSWHAVKCASINMARMDANLDDTYKKLQAHFHDLANGSCFYENLPNLLSESQNAWLNFRKKECSLVAESYKGGSLQPALWSDCMSDFAEKRMEFLRDTFDKYTFLAKKTKKAK